MPILLYYYSTLLNRPKLTRANYILVFLLALCSMSVMAQEETNKGTSSLIIRKKKNTGIKRAVVVGVSDYQNDQIPDLRFAHTDAEAFSDYLKSPSGGDLKADNIKLLLNEDATGGNVRNALDWIVKQTKKDDQCIIYFSGHGDVETLYEEEPGHFLVYDSPSSTYQINSLRVEDLKLMVANLSKDVGAKVLVITDACRSGTLAGSGIKGAQATAAAFLDQFDNEIKIMSCQANEYSIEGEQWGGGRGMFSYHMIEGLVGMADNNNDKEVNVKELHRYLEDRFEEDQTNNKQSPVAVGDRTAAIAVVNEEALVALRSGKGSEVSDIAAVEIKTPKNPQDALLEDFYAALQDERLIGEIEGDSSDLRSAEYYFAQIEQSTELGAKAPILKGDFIAALQDEAQSAINRYLAIDQQEMKKRWFAKKNDFGKYAAYLGKAADMIGEFHYFYPQVKAKELYFSVLGERIKLDRAKGDKEEYEKLVPTIKEALVYQERSPYIYNELGLVYRRAGDCALALESFDKAIAISPTWAIPYNNKSKCYNVLKQYDQAIVWAEKALGISNNYASALLNLSNAYFRLDSIEKSIDYDLQYLQIIPSSKAVLSNVASKYNDVGNSASAIFYCNKALEIDSNYIIAIINRGIFLAEGGEYERAKIDLEKALKQPAKYGIAYYTLGYCHENLLAFDQAKHNYLLAIEKGSLLASRAISFIYLKEKNYVEAEKHLLNYLNNTTESNIEDLINLAFIYGGIGNKVDFRESMLKALNQGFSNKEVIENSEHLNAIRNSKEYIDILSQL